MASFRHSGKLGDVVYSLPTVRALGGGQMLLNTHCGYEFSEEGGNAIIPLLRDQSYIESVKIWQGESIDYDLDRFRHCGSPNTTNLADAHLFEFDLPAAERDTPWLVTEADRRVAKRPVFSRSVTHRGVNGFWDTCLSLLPGAVFVGTSVEHECFEKLHGEIEYLPTADLLELAQVIAGSSVFVGNQSCPYAIAEGLKLPVIQETDPGTANCVFERATACQVKNESSLNGLPQFVETCALLRTTEPARSRCGTTTQ